MPFNRKKLKLAIQGLLERIEPFSGSAYRVVRQGLVSNYGVEAIISGVGPKRFQGGRWMSKGICYALYASFAAKTAIEEVLYNDEGDNNTFAIAKLDVALDKVLDLTNKEHLKALELSVKDLTECEYSLEGKRESLTQAIGHLAYELEIEGIIVPSALDPKAHNLVVFSDGSPVKGVIIEEHEIFET